MTPIINCEEIKVVYSYSEYRYSSFKEFVMQKLSKRNRVHEIRAVDGVSFQAQRGESIALMGHNGSGKSTLLKVLAGIIISDNKSFSISGRIAPMIELGTGFDGELSGYENIILSCALMGLTQEEVESRIESIVEFSELREFIDMPLKNYSSGMQARLGFACATAVDPDILLIDEVLAVGDQNFSKKCLYRIDQLRKLGTTVVLVSHDINTMKTFCSRGIVLERGKMKFDGDIETAALKHEEIMHQRFLDSMLPEQRSEYLRKTKLEADSDTYLSGKNSDRPKIVVHNSFFQEDQKVAEVDLAKKFTLRFYLKIVNPELFHGSISFGIGLQLPNGTRVGGVNNLDIPEKSKAIGIEKNLMNSGLVEVDFRFDNGIAELCSGDYVLIFAVHDEKLTRTLFCEVVGVIKAINTSNGFNSDNDVLNLSKSIGMITAKSN